MMIKLLAKILAMGIIVCAPFSQSFANDEGAWVINKSEKHQDYRDDVNAQHYSGSGAGGIIAAPGDRGLILEGSMKAIGQNFEFDLSCGKSQVTHGVYIFKWDGNKHFIYFPEVNSPSVGLCCFSIQDDKKTIIFWENKNPAVACAPNA